MNGLPLHNDGELPSFPSLPSFSFLDLMNDSNRDLTLQNLTVQDVLNPVMNPVMNPVRIQGKANQSSSRQRPSQVFWNHVQARCCKKK